MTIQSITSEHLDLLAQIPARYMVRAHMIAAMPCEADQVAEASVINDFIVEMVGPIYDLCADPEADGLQGAITNAAGTLCHNRRFIERGGSKKYPNELPKGHWRFAADGRKAAIAWIDKLGGYNGYFEHLIKLAADIAPSCVSQSQLKGRETAPVGAVSSLAYL